MIRAPVRCSSSDRPRPGLSITAPNGGVGRLWPLQLSTRPQRRAEHWETVRLPQISKLVGQMHLDSPPALKCLIWSLKVSSKLYLAAPPVCDAWKDWGGGSGTGCSIPNYRNTLSPRYHSTWSRYISSTRARKYGSDIATAGLAA